MPTLGLLLEGKKARTKGYSCTVFRIFADFISRGQFLKKKITSDLSVPPHQRPREGEQRRGGKRWEEMNDSAWRTSRELRLCCVSSERENDEALKDQTVLFLFFVFNRSLLEYNCFTILC